MKSKLPRPNKEGSIEEFFRSQWDVIIDDWKRGWMTETSFQFLEDHLEFERQRVFVDKTKVGNFDWEKDWLAANELHNRNIDFIENQKKYFNDLRDFWSEWQQKVYAENSTLRAESFKAMVLVTGAGIVAGISILTNDNTTMPIIVVWVAKCTILTSAISVIMTALGHALADHYDTTAAATVRALLVGHTKQKRLTAFSRFMRRYISPKIDIAQKLTYGAIILFGINALVSAFMLMGV